VAVKRAAHRPSRKQIVVQAAMRLHAAGSPEAVTVADIAAEAKMTSAAVFYHYSMKEDVLLEGLATFGAAMGAEVAAFLSRGNAGSPADLAAHMLDWLEHDHDSAVVWFAYSSGLSVAIEGCRRSTNEQIIAELVKAVKAHRRDFPLPHASVVAAALFSLVEVSARAWLIRETRWVEGNEKEFRAAVSALGSKILASPVPTR
jgi:AcrR family transcriptional regulator